jgi:hypothetical protein
MVSELLVVRAEDLVVLALEYDGCEASAHELTAVTDGATITVIFPPQGISETKVEGASPQGAWLSAPSTVVCPLPVGTTLPLTVGGVLTALTSHPLDTTRTVIELPYGLRMSPRTADGGAVTASGPTQPVINGDGTSGLWELVLADADATGRGIVGDHVFAPDAVADVAGDVAPLDESQRGTIQATNARPAIDRLRLSALGGSLTASTSYSFLVWNHRTALGRDARVLFQQNGVLWPFGHRATLTETAERRVDDDGNAALHRETTLRISQPLLSFPMEGTRDSRGFPFHEVELLGGQVTGVVLHGEAFWAKPVDLTDAVQVEIETEAEALDTAARQWAPALPIPTTLEEFLQSSYADVDAGNYLDAAFHINELQMDIDDVIANEYVDPDTGEVFESASDYNAIQSYKAQQVPYQEELMSAAANINSTLQVLRPLVPSWQEQEDLVLWARRIAGLGDPGAQYVVGLADALNALKASVAEAEPPTVSTIHDGAETGPEHQFHVRLGGRLGDVPLTMALRFVHDLEVPAQTIGGYDFPGYTSLDDDTLTDGLIVQQLPVPGVNVDLVRRPTPMPIDVQELHSVTLRANYAGSGLRPVLYSFELTLPELRTLLPDHDSVHGAVLSSALVNSNDASVPFELIPAVDVDFAQHAEKAGGLLVPSFSADRISAAHGPVDARALVDQGEAALAALGRMRLLGVGLSTLLDRFQGAPAILQELKDGIPRGVTMDWKDQVLKTVGPFVAHGKGSNDPTTMTVHVEQTLDSTTTTCSLTAFSLILPSPSVAVVSAYLDSLAFVADPGHEPTLKVGRFDLEFGDVLDLVKDLADKADLGDAAPHVKIDDSGITASYWISIPDASSGVFLLSNIAFGVDLSVPFRAGSPSVQFSFAKPEAPFAVRVPPFGGSGYLDLTVDAGGLQKVAGSLEFGGSVGVDFKIVKAEAHVMVGVRVEYDGAVTIAGFVHIGGSVKLLGLVTISVDLRVELAYDGHLNELYGHATLVIEIDLTLYSKSIELDSGLWVFAGGSQTPPPELGAAAAQSGWEQHQGAYA